MDILSFGLPISQSSLSQRRTKSVIRREPENQNLRIVCFYSLKRQNFSNNQFLDSEFVVGRAKRGKRSNLYWLKSVIDAEKTVESEGRKTESDLRSYYYDAIVIGSGIGGLVAATQLAVRGAKVLLLEKYVIPGGSSGFYQRDGFTFNVGSSVMFSFSDKIFNALNSLELKSLEEPIYLFGQFFKKPLECLTLGDITRKYIKDPELLSFIDTECFIVSTVNAKQTPTINACMVLCDGHFGGINYPVGGIGEIAKTLAKGLINHGSNIIYRANATNIVIENGQAVGVKLSDGREFYAKTIISNATRWDTFEKLLKKEVFPKEEERFQKAYVKAPSFLSIHLGVKAEVLPPNTDCHHFVLEDDWKY